MFQDTEKYKQLRNMESFTREMFDRIISFQEKENPAWDQSLSFDERIRELPLHALIFSNPDRDPERFSHTVAPYYPVREELYRIAGFVRKISNQPVICDFECGNGFVGSLLGRTGFDVIGVRSQDRKPNQIERFFDEECYRVSDTSIENIDFGFDVAFSSWMPAGKNQTPLILQHHPKLIIYVHTEHYSEETGMYQTGVPEAFADLPDNYKLIDAWTVTRPKDLLHDIWPDLTGNIEEIRHTKIYADTGFHHLVNEEECIEGEPYCWERELEMALLAMDAKETLRSRGALV